MKKEVFTLEDSEDVNDLDTKKTKANIHLVKSDKKKKTNKNEPTSDNIPTNKILPFEEHENIEFILMDFRQPEELNKFKNMKSLSLIQQNISSLKVIFKNLFS